VNNSSTTPLLPGGVFTGASDYVVIYKSIVINASSDRSSASGGLSIQFSTDNINWDFVYTYNVVAGTPFAVTLQVIAPYVRVVYTNGTVGQLTFRLQTVLVAQQEIPAPLFPVPSTPTSSSSVAITSPTDAFDDVALTQKLPDVITTFLYNLNNTYITTTATGSGTATQANSMILLQTGTTSTSSMTAKSVALSKYLPGSGLKSYLTPVYGPAIVGSTQYVGIGIDLTNGFYIGYNGTSFGVFHANGVSSVFYAQSSWNLDTLNGLGPSRMNLNPLVGNVFQIQVQWLGYGNINFAVENPATSQFINFHTIKYPNTASIPSLVFPSFYCIGIVTNGASTTNVSMSISCMTIYNEGNSPLTRPGIRFSASVSTGYSPPSSAARSILSIYNKPTAILGTLRSNYTPIALDQISLATSGNRPVRFQAILNPTSGVTGGSASWVDVSTTTSVTAFSTTNAPIAGGTVIMTFELANTDALNELLTIDVIQLYPGQWLVITLLTPSESTTNYAALSWREFF